METQVMREVHREERAKEDKAKVTKCLFPVAGLGTRFLPVTKEIAKEMLPLVNRPIISYGVKEALASGYSDIIMITRIFLYASRSKSTRFHLTSLPMCKRQKHAVVILRFNV